MSVIPTATSLRRHALRGVFLVGAIVIALVALVGCGGGGSKSPAVASVGTTKSPATTAGSASSAPPTPSSQTQRLIVYSECMRRNGVTNFPDPNSHGNLVINPNANINPSSPQYKQAQAACKKFSPESSSGAGMTPAQHAEALAALTDYVHCMRKHGIEMADPFSGPNNGVGIALPRDIDVNSQLYKQADSACKHFIPSAG
jgi:hypothetical protein